MNQVSRTILMLCIALFLVPQSTAGNTYSEEYIANGVITVFCEGEGEDVYLNEPWCLALNTLHDGEESVIGGAEWDVADHLGSLAIYSAIDQAGLPHTLLGMSDHGHIHEATEGCGALTYIIPAEWEGDEIDGGIHLAAQISIIHVTQDLVICLGSTGIATIDIA